MAGIDGGGSPSASASAFGTITGFGSVSVNGIRFETANATITIDGRPGVQSDLSVGDVVLVKGRLDDSEINGTADSVSFDDNVEGPISSLNPLADTFVVLSQLVRVTAGTSFDASIQPGSLNGLSPGDIVEVTGLVNSTGVIEATRIERKPAGGQLEVTGLVSTPSSGTSQFNINSLVVDFSSAMLLSFSSGSISEGDLVEVKADGLGGAGELIATQVELKSGQLDGDQNDRLELEGFITRFLSATDFDVAGFPVITDEQTVFEGGAATALNLNIIVEVEGTLNASGTLLASLVGIHRPRDVRATAVVDSVSAGGNSFVMLGIPVNVDRLTRIEDKSTRDIEPFGLGQLAAGDYVTVRGTEFPAGSGQILAARLEREDIDTATLLQGFVTDFTEPTVTILGVRIETGSETLFQDQNDSQVPSTEFFGALTAGALVTAKGVEIAAQAIAATEIGFEFDTVPAASQPGGDPAQPGGDPNDHVIIEGLITRFISATEFDIAGFPVVTNEQTIFEGGVAADLGLNLLVEVEGDLNSNRVIIASLIAIPNPGDVRVTALVDSVDAAGNSFVTLEITVSLDSLTRIEDKSAQDVEPFSLTQLAAGDYVALRGTEFPAGSGQILASRLQREDLDTATNLQGSVTDFAEPTITILGVTIETDSRTVFSDRNEAFVSSAEFFGGLNRGALLTIEGVEVGARTIAATDVVYELN